MKRIALLISNPGETGDEDYANGVYRDIQNYTAFLQEPIGGYWEENAIYHLDRPTKSKLAKYLSAISEYDYSLIIFTGHGGYDIEKDTTILQLQQGHDIDSNMLHGITKRETLIIDACRVFPTEKSLSESFSRIARANPPMDPTRCLELYNQRIGRCLPATVTMFSCSIGETVDDDDNIGGLYSHHLIRCARRWALDKAPDITDETGYILSVVAAHKLSAEKVVPESAGDQNPRIRKPRTEPYFPFAVVA